MSLPVVSLSSGPAGILARQRGTTDDSIARPCFRRVNP